MARKQLGLNLVANITSYMIATGISFFLTPYIVTTIGPEAYGFVALANNFISYAVLLTIALNSMSGRFIVIAIHQNDYKNAGEYYSSTFYANLVCLLVLLIPSLLCVVFINKLVNVPSHILLDVQLLVAFLFINFLTGLLTTNLEVPYYVRNKLYLSSVIQIQSNIIRSILLVSLFMFFKPKILFLGLVSFICLLYTTVFNCYYKKKLLPELTIKLEYLNFNKVKELVSSGIWNTITRLGSTLLEGLDLLIANLFLGASAMGTLALAKTIPALFSSALSSLVSVFLPGLTELYAKEKRAEFVRSIRQGIRIIGVLINIPVAIFVVYGDVFFRLWVPTQNAEQLYLISIISSFPLAVLGPISIMHNVFTIINRVKLNSIILIFTGLLNCVIVYTLLRTTNFGLYAIAGVSVIMSVLRNLIYTVPFGTSYIGCKWNTFFPDLIRSLVSLVITILCGLVLKSGTHIDSWSKFLMFAVINLAISLISSCCIILDTDERQHLLSSIKRIGR